MDGQINDKMKCIQPQEMNRAWSLQRLVPCTNNMKCIKDDRLQRWPHLLDSFMDWTLQTSSPLPVWEAFVPLHLPGPRDMAAFESGPRIANKPARAAFNYPLLLHKFVCILH